MRKRWTQLRHLLTRRIRYKITRGGVLFTAAIMAVGAAAVLSGNNLLFLIVAVMMATLLVSGFVSRLCLAALELDFLVPEHVAARRTVPARLYVRNQKICCTPASSIPGFWWRIPSHVTRHANSKSSAPASNFCSIGVLRARSTALPVDVVNQLLGRSHDRRLPVPG